MRFGRVTLFCLFLEAGLIERPWTACLQYFFTWNKPAYPDYPVSLRMVCDNNLKLRALLEINILCMSDDAGSTDLS